MYLQDIMKKSEKITVRVDDSIKERFVEVCEFEKTTMSDKISSFIAEENKKDTTTIEEKYKQLLGAINGNITIVDEPAFFSEYEKRTFHINQIKDNFPNILKRYPNTRIYLYLKGCDIPNDLFRLVIRDL